MGAPRPGQTLWYGECSRTDYCICNCKLGYYSAVNRRGDEQVGRGVRLTELGRHQEEAWELFVHSHALLERAMDAELRAEHGMSLLTMDALVQLSRAPEQTLYMKDLAAALVYSASGITRVVDNLERAGHVTRNPDPTNRRATLVKLTSQGRDALAEAWSLHVGTVRRLFTRHVDDRQAKVLIDVFNAVVKDLEGPPKA